MTYIKDDLFSRSVAALKRLVTIPSYLQAPVAGCPFGAAIQQGLEETLSLFQSLGMNTYLDPDGYYGYGEIGEGELFAVLCHIDVVPADNFDKWRFPPFSATIAEDTIFGRGTQDNKGPTIAALFALKALLEKGEALNKKVRFIVGADEENLWRCMDKYTKEQPVASMGFAPDSKFPLNYAEKGLLQFHFTNQESVDFSFTGGKALNVVPNTAHYVGHHVTALKELAEHQQIEHACVQDELTVYGKAAHSKDAPIGLNAITQMATLLAPFYPENSALDLLATIKQEATGRSVLGDISDEPSGRMTLNVAKITMNPSQTQITFDIRYPVTLEKSVLVNQLIALGKRYGLVYEEFDYLAPLYVPLEAELTTKLLQAYQQVTGDVTSKPVASGGATYARTMPNCVAFGAMFLTTVDTFHQIDEHWRLDDMRLAMEVYAEAFKRLCFD